MSYKWLKTNYPGVRYREHLTRKKGIKKDRYYTIRYYIDDGQRKEEGLGWSSEGWTAEKAAQQLSELKKARRTGEGPLSLKEKRDSETERREQEAKLKIQEEINNITFHDFFYKSYYPTAQTSKKKSSYEKEEQHFRLWIEPVLGSLLFKDIKPFTIERIKKNMMDKGLSSRMVEYVLATIRQIWNQAIRDEMVSSESPTKKVRLVKIDNRRLRFLNHEEANLLLNALKVRDKQIYLISLLSLHTGMRMGEIFKLKWGDVDIKQGMITIKDAKTGNRTAFMTGLLKDAFKEMIKTNNDDFLFLSPLSKAPFKEMPKIFSIIVNEVGLNKDITDSRQKIVPHSLRHTYASWLVQDGVDLYTVQKLMGHGSITMTQRYAHLSPKTLQEAVKTLEKGIKNSNKFTEISQHK